VGYPLASILDQPSIIPDHQTQAHEPGRHVGRPRLAEVRQVDAASRNAPLAMRLRSPQAVIGKPIEEVAETDLRPEFGCQPRQSVSPIARANPAGDPDDHKGIEGEAVAVVHPSCS
jgi:hypothetical protein